MNIVVSRVRSDAPRLSDVQSLSVTIINDHATRSDDKQTSTPERHKTSASDERKSHKRSSYEVKRHHSRSAEKSEVVNYTLKKTVRVPQKRSRSAGADKDTESDDSMTVVAVEKRLSRAKTVRMYRSVKLNEGAADNSGSDGDGGKTSGPTARKIYRSASANRVGGKKTSNGRVREGSSKWISGRNDGRKASEEASGSGSSCSRSSHGSCSGKHRSQHSSSRGQTGESKHKTTSSNSASSYSSHSKRDKTSL